MFSGSKRLMGLPSDDIERKQCREFIDRILKDAVVSRASEILFRSEKDRVQVFYLIDGKYEKNLAVPQTLWEQILSIFDTDYFENGSYEFTEQDIAHTFNPIEDAGGVVRFRLSRKPAGNRSVGELEDIFRVFEDEAWDGIKSIFLSVLNLALEQGYDEIHMELSGSVVQITYFLSGEKKTSMIISSDSYDALARLIGENYLAFGFMTREFRDKEYLVRLRELNEDLVAPRIRLEIEQLSQ